MSLDDILLLKQEIQLLAMLDHPNIVKIREAFEDEAAITIVMEICSGFLLFTCYQIHVLNVMINNFLNHKIQYHNSKGANFSTIFFRKCLILNT